MATRQCVVFRTPGHIDKRSFTVVGLHAKPNSTNPLGQFGSGLKYAIAILLRLGHEVTIFIGHEQYVFYTKQGKFRGAEYQQIRMKRRRGLFSSWTYEDLPFTTDLGKGWELWQAFRELETNTRDEGGTTGLEHWDEKVHPTADETCIVVYGQKFVDEYHDMWRNFLPEGKVVREDAAIQIIEKPSKHIYYRGMRVMDLEETSAFTYNFLKHIELTEDRTVKYPYEIEAALAEYFMTTDNEDHVIKGVRHATGYEGRIHHGYGNTLPSPTYLDHAAYSPNPTAKARWDQSRPTVKTKVEMRVTIPKAGLEDEELDSLLMAVFLKAPTARIVYDHAEYTFSDEKGIVKGLDDVPF
jgi:hypothetical protein